VSDTSELKGRGGDWTEERQARNERGRDEGRSRLQADRKRAGDTACYGEVCITCSDTAVEVTVVRLLDDGLAVVDTGQGEEEVSVALVQAGPGDTILVHAKEAIAVLGSR
jgi:hydrogenase expression/formation protein HypC